MKATSKLILLLFIGILLPFMIMSFFDYKESQDIIKRKIESDLSANIKHKLFFMQKHAEHILGDVKMLASNPLLLTYVKNKNYELNSYLKYRQSFFYDYFVITTDGEIVYTLKKEDDYKTNIISGAYKNSSLSKMFSYTLKTGKSCISDFQYFAPSNKIAAFIAYPIFDDNKKIVSIFAVQLNIDAWYDIANDFSGLGSSGEVVIASNIKGKALFLNKLRNDDKSAFLRYVKIGSNDGKAIQKAVQGKYGSGVYYDYKHKKVIAAWGYMPEYRIGMVVKIDTDEAYEGIVKLRNFSIVLGLFVFMVILYIIYIIFKIVKDVEDTKQRYEMAINGTRDGLWDWNLVSNEIYFSKSWKKQLGYKDNELENILETWQSNVHPDDIKLLKETYKKNIHSRAKQYENTYRIRHKDGHWVWILERGKTLFDSHGKAIRMVGFHTDISKEKELEIKLKESKKLFDMFMNYTPYIMIIKDENNKIIYENPVAQKYPYFDTLNTKVDKLITNVIENYKAEDIFEVKHNDEIYVFRALAFAIPQEDSKTYIGMIFVDITQQKSLANKLEEQRELMIIQSRHAAMGEMISMIAHQWRQPISVIAMDANNVLVDIELDSIDKDSLKSDIDDIMNQTQHLSKTIDDFRDFFKPNKLKDKVLVSDVFKEALKVIEKSLLNNNIKYTNIFTDVTKVSIFSRELLQVFLNILKNAKESLAENKINDKEIVNKVYEDDNNIIIEIIDNGGGIEDAVKDKIFDPYFSTKDEKNGTGLGLYMCKTIIQKHINGIIEVDSVDKKTCFRIIIPIESETEVQIHE